MSNVTKNVAIHKIINSKPAIVKLHGRMSIEAFKLFHLKNKIVSKAKQVLINRIELLSLAETLALQDKNMKNFNENIDMMIACVREKLELLDKLHGLDRRAA